MFETKPQPSLSASRAHLPLQVTSPYPCQLLKSPSVFETWNQATWGHLTKLLSRLTNLLSHLTEILNIPCYMYIKAKLRNSHHPLQPMHVAFCGQVVRDFFEGCKWISCQLDLAGLALNRVTLDCNNGSDTWTLWTQGRTLQCWSGHNVEGAGTFNL